MTLPVTGSLSLGDVLAEIRLENPARALPISLGDADVIALAGKSAPVALSDLYGKSSYIPMTITGFPGDSPIADSSSQGGTVQCSPAITVTGGSGGYVVSWAFVSNPDGCSLAGGNALFCTVSKSYLKNANGDASAIVRATVTDSTNHTVTCDVSASLLWSNNA